MNFKTTIVLLFLLICASVFVYVAHDRSREETAKPVEQHKLLDLSPSDLNKVVITASDGKRTVLERADHKWRLTEPVQAPADTMEVDTVLSELTGLTATVQVPTSGSDAPKTGLDQPQYKIELAAKGSPTTLLVGNKLVVSDGVYVQVAGQKEADVVPAGFLEKLDGVAKTVRDKKMVEASSAEIRQLELTRPEGRVVLQKKADKWEIVEPMAAPADSGNMNSFLAALTGLKAVSFDEARARTGLNAPVLTISYSTQTPATQPTTDKSKTPVVSGIVRFGDFADAMQKNVFAQSGETGAPSAASAVARVSVDSLNSLNKTALDLRDRSVVDLPLEQVSEFSIKTDIPATTQPTTQPAKSTVISIVHRAISPPMPGTNPSTHPTAPAFRLDEWVFAGGGTASKAEVGALLNALHPLKAEKFLDKPAADKPVAQYVVTATTIGPGGAPVTGYAIDIVDPGNGRALEGRYNGLTFELPRTLLKTVQADFVDRPGKMAPPMPPQEGMPPQEPTDEPSIPRE